MDLRQRQRMLVQDADQARNVTWRAISPAAPFQLDRVIVYISDGVRLAIVLHALLSIDLPITTRRRPNASQAARTAPAGLDGPSANC